MKTSMNKEEIQQVLDIAKEKGDMVLFQEYSRMMRLVEEGFGPQPVKQEEPVEEPSTPIDNQPREEGTGVTTADVLNQLRFVYGVIKRSVENPNCIGREKELRVAKMVSQTAVQAAVLNKRLVLEGAVKRLNRLASWTTKLREEN